VAKGNIPLYTCNEALLFPAICDGLNGSRYFGRGESGRVHGITDVLGKDPMIMVVREGLEPSTSAL
jgi:hypothetical protein